MENLKIGFTIGKFAPFHKGHQYLIETALKEMDKVYVFVYDTNILNIPTETRAKWIKDLYPEVETIIAHNPPSRYGLDRESVNIQMEYLVNQLGDIKPTHFYSSEKYGEHVAKFMNIENRQVDLERKTIPISATKVRENIEQNKAWIEKEVYEDMKKMTNNSVL